jgi:PAS domain-containing protein
MAVREHDKAGMLRTVFDAIPSLIFIVDDDVRIQEFNAAAAELLAGSREAILKRRGGDVLNCLHATGSPEGCGRASFCNNCVIRDSVTQALQGNRVVRRRTKIEMLRNGTRLEMYALITASPFRFKSNPFVLLVIEDISEIAELQRLIPICSICKEIRDEKEAWSRMEVYFKEHWDVDFSHSLCPKCYQAEMEKMKQDRQAVRSDTAPTDS